MAEPQKLTKSLIDAFEPRAKDTIYWDSEVKGLGVKVTPTGRKVFLVMHRPKGHLGAAKKFTIGTYGEWTLQRARDRAREVLVEGSKGTDLGAQLRQEKRRLASDRISDLVGQFLDKHAAQNRTGDETKRILHHDLMPKFGKRSIHELTTHDVISIIEGVANRGSPIMANRTLAAIRKFLNWCISRGIITASPAQGVASQAREVSRDRTLTPDETSDALAAARQMAYPFGSIVELLFMTAQRRDEVAAMRWSEVDLDKAVWTIPAARAKNGKVHDVHLSKCAVGLLRSLPRFVLADNSESDFVFTTTGETPFSGFSKAKDKLDTKMLEAMRKRASENGKNPDQGSILPWRLHDIRRTVATELSKLGVAIHITEAILNHKSGTISGVTAVYQRNQFPAERRDALNKWCDRIDAIMLNDAENGVGN